MSSGVADPRPLSALPSAFCELSSPKFEPRGTFFRLEPVFQDRLPMK